MEPASSRRFLGAYLAYGLFHLALSPLLALRGWLRARRRWYERILWARLAGGSRPPRRERWLVLVAGGLGEARPALRVAEEAARRGIPACVLVQRQEALGMDPQTFVGALPFNNPISAVLFLLRYRPRAVLAVEYSENHHLTALASLAGVPVVAFNALVSADLAQRSERWRFQTVGLWLAQGETDAQRLRALGVAEPRVRAFGAVGVAAAGGFAERRAETEAKWRGALGLREDAFPVIVAGSTHPDDERCVLAAFADLRATHPHAVLVLAPRDLKRDVPWRAVLAEAGVEWASRSSGEPVPESGVFVLDTFGELGELYAAATVAHVGGTLDPRRGGHTPAEALAWGVPITTGPERDQQRVLTDALIDAGVLEVRRSPEEFAASWRRWADDSEGRADVRARSESFLHGQERRVGELLDLVLPDASPE